ncbi:MAG: fasciclin domain-containing protein [Flavobacteriales bacterium]|nr:fasciclin domain-containing protein [Flavobacteriales bacterium]
MKYFNINTFLASVLCLFSFNAFSQTVFEIIENSELHNTLEAAIVAAELNETLSSEGTFTVFAPTDDAFSVIPENVLESLLADPSGDLTQILLNHVVSSVAMSTDLSDGMMIETLQGSEVMVSITDGVVMIDNATVIVADIMADNGVVHVIDAILQPEMPTNTVFDIIAASEVHNTLETAIVAAGLDGTLASEGPFTVFAPTDDAFSLVPANVLETLLADPTGLLTQILLNHVVSGTALSTDLSDGMMIETLQGSEVMVSITDGVVMIGNATVIVADITADNGVVHVIDAILQPEMPTNTVFDIIANSEVHNTLETAIVAAGLDGVLSSEGPFTVFAPTDDAFGLIPADVIETLLADPTGLLTQILLNHVVSGTALSTDLSDGMMIETLQGSEVMVSITDGVVMIGNATVVMADITADNGVVHVIDAVIETTVNNIIESSAIIANDIYLFSVDITGREINYNTTNTIVFDIYKSGKTVKRFVTIQ